MYLRRPDKRTMGGRDPGSNGQLILCSIGFFSRRPVSARISRASIGGEIDMARRVNAALGPPAAQGPRADAFTPSLCAGATRFARRPVTSTPPPARNSEIRDSKFQLRHRHPGGIVGGSSEIRAQCLLGYAETIRGII